jgi:hypothetical protein
MIEKNIFIRYSPKEPEDLDQIIRSSYDDFVRMERRNLLMVSSVIIFSFYAGIKPEKVSMLGFGFSNFNKEIYYLVLLILCLYFLIAYIIYALPGFRYSINNWQKIKSKAMKISGNKHRWSIEIKNYLSNGRYYIWIVFNYIFPLVVGIGAAIISAVSIT